MKIVRQIVSRCSVRELARIINVSTNTAHNRIKHPEMLTISEMDSILISRDMPSLWELLEKADAAHELEKSLVREIENYKKRQLTDQF